MKILLIISFIFLSSCEEIFLRLKTFKTAPDQNKKIFIELRSDSDPGRSANGIFSIKSVSGNSVTLNSCTNFDAYQDGETVISTICDIVNVNDGTYNIEKKDINIGSNTYKLNVNTALDYKALVIKSNSATDAELTKNILTVSKIEKNNGIIITFQPSISIDEDHSSVYAAFMITGYYLTCDIKKGNANTDTTASCSFPDKIYAGDYYLEENGIGARSGTYQFTVAIANNAQKTITITEADLNSNNKSGFVSFSKYLVIIFILLF